MAKNRLSTDDAKRVEDAFAARMAVQGAVPEALTKDELASALSDPTPPQPPTPSTDAVKPLRQRGRPRKVKAAAEQSDVPSVPSNPNNDDNPPASTHLQVDCPVGRL
jgi:hypothetical protein